MAPHTLILLVGVAVFGLVDVIARLASAHDPPSPEAARTRARPARRARQLDAVRAIEAE